jgi:transcriptional regulatory protein RtcR
MASSSAPLVVIGLLGSTLDRGEGSRRWEAWRPTISLFQHEELLISRFELLFERKFTALAQAVVRDIAAVSPETTVRTHEISMKDAWDFEEVYGFLLDFSRNYPFDPEREDYLVHITTGSHVQQICLFLLTEARRFPAKLIQTSPPTRTAGRKPGAYQVIDLDLSRYDKIAARFVNEQREASSFLKSGIATKNAAFNRLIDRLEKVAILSKAPILLLGPTGAGKSLLARRIFELKKVRRQVGGPFVEVNCATIRGDAAMSALFGHERGAFTGAAEKRSGLLRAANGGVLFLDEIGELGLDEQAMLLRALEEKRFLPLGSDREVESDFQLIAGTNRDLGSDVATKRFREDLLARINLWTYRLPALCERIEDIEPNLDFELDLYARKNGESVRFNREARERFLRFAASPSALWSGNFRDLNAAVTRMATLAESARIRVEDVLEEEERLLDAWRRGDPSRPALTASSTLASVLTKQEISEIDLFDAVQLDLVVKTCRESRSLSEAGRKLFAASRTKKETPNDADRLRKYLARFGLTFEQIVRTGGSSRTTSSSATA